MGAALPPRRPVSSGFGKERRIRKRVDFLHVQSKGARVSSRHFTLLVARNDDPSAPARLGIVATVKIGGAVERNRVKRLCRECFRTWHELLPNGVDLVVVARAGAHELGLSDVRDEWEQARRTLQKRAAEALAKSPPKAHVSPRARPAP